MQRVLIIGCGGAGKSTLATRLAARTGLPLEHLDRHYWGPGWAPTPSEAWETTVTELMAPPRWIMDGNYGGTLPMRLRACDTVIFLDTPRHVCLRRVVQRRFRRGGRTRAGRPRGCPERLTAGFLHWIWSYPRRRRPGILRRLEALPPTKRVAILDSPSAIERYLERARPSASEVTGSSR